MPFMPEMFAFCGQKFQVFKRAHKTCDTVFPTRSRRVDRSVHLATRCDGQAHGGCQAADCLIFWKEAWLKGENRNSPGNGAEPAKDAPRGSSRRSEALYHRIGCPGSHAEPGHARWSARLRLPSHAPSVRDDAIGLVGHPVNTSRITRQETRAFGACSRALVYSSYIQPQPRQVSDWALRCDWLYDKLYPLWSGHAIFPRKSGTIPVGPAGHPGGMRSTSKPG
jgi:hypothetical protein